MAYAFIKRKNIVSFRRFYQTNKTFARILVSQTKLYFFCSINHSLKLAVFSKNLEQFNTFQNKEISPLFWTHTSYNT